MTGEESNHSNQEIKGEKIGSSLTSTFPHFTSRGLNIAKAFLHIPKSLQHKSEKEIGWVVLKSGFVTRNKQEHNENEILPFVKNKIKLFSKAEA